MLSPGQIAVEVVVFAAVAWGVWVVVPLLAAVGLEQSTGKYIKSEGAAFDPLYRFTTPDRLAQASWGVGLLFGGLAVTVLLMAGVENPVGLVLAGLVGGIIAFRIPRALINGRIKRRNELFQRRLVDVTLGLANGLRAGAALPQALSAVTGDVGGPVGEEFSVLLQEYHYGVDLSECLERLGKRMPGEDLQLLITAVKLTLQSGGSLAEVLDKITNTIRQRVEFQERLKTLTAQGRFEAIAMASAPLVAFLLLYAIQPSLMQPLVATQGGWMALGVVAVMETIGFLWIRKIVNVEA
ncbi:MAG: type II secretion system F family protein [Verrucomicrobiota bacterium]